MKANQIQIDLCFFQKQITYKKHVCPQYPAFSCQFIGICEFNPSQTNMHGTKNLWELIRP